LDQTKTYSEAVAALRQSIAAHRDGASGPRRFSTATKRAALRLVEGGVAIEDLAHELNLQPSLLYRWKRKAARNTRLEPAPKQSVRPRVLDVDPSHPTPREAAATFDGAALHFVAGGFAVTITQAGGRP